jgi:hypothetical protein
LNELFGDILSALVVSAVGHAFENFFERDVHVRSSTLAIIPHAGINRFPAACRLPCLTQLKHTRADLRSSIQRGFRVAHTLVLGSGAASIQHTAAANPS